jgi:hypothetical protein
MILFRRGLAGKLGAAIGVAAMLGLALVAPIHHLHAIARDFGTAQHAGHATQQPCHGEHAGPAQGPPAKPSGSAPVYCPMCTLGKMAAALLPPSLPLVAIPLVTGDAPVFIATPTPSSNRPERVARPRAPPVQA